MSVKRQSKRTVKMPLENDSEDAVRRDSKMPLEKTLERTVKCH